MNAGSRSVTGSSLYELNSVRGDVGEIPRQEASEAIFLKISDLEWRRLEGGRVPSGSLLVHISTGIWTGLSPRSGHSTMFPRTAAKGRSRRSGLRQVLHGTLCRKRFHQLRQRRLRPLSTEYVDRL